MMMRFLLLEWQPIVPVGIYSRSCLVSITSKECHPNSGARLRAVLSLGFRQDRFPSVELTPSPFKMALEAPSTVSLYIII